MENDDKEQASTSWTNFAFIGTLMELKPKA